MMRVILLLALLVGYMPLMAQEHTTTVPLDRVDTIRFEKGHDGPILVTLPLSELGEVLWRQGAIRTYGTISYTFSESMYKPEEVTVRTKHNTVTVNTETGEVVVKPKE